MPIIVGNTTTNSAITSTSLSEMAPQSFVVTNALRNTIRPALLLPFAQSGTVDPRITFTRSSSATYFNSLGVLTTAPINVPRIDFDPVTGRCLGLLIEEGRTNLLLQSTFQSGWGSGNGTLSANQLLSPDGTVNAAKFVENTVASAFHYIYQNVTKAASALVYTFSVFLKASGNRQVTLRLSDGTGTNGAVVTCDPVAGTIATAGVYGTFTSASGTIQTIGNGWYRFSLTTTSSTATTIIPGLESVSAGTNVYTGDGVSGFYCFGAQLEQNTFATSVIATTTAAATRTIENARIPLGSWYNASAFSLLVEAQKNTTADTGFATPVELNDGTTTRRTTIYNNVFTATMRFSGGGADVPAGTYTTGVPYKIAGAITGTSTTTGTIAASFNGVIAGTGTTTNLDSASYTNMNIGYIGGIGAGNQMNGWIQRIAYYPVAFSNTQLQAMSS